MPSATDLPETFGLDYQPSSPPQKVFNYRFNNSDFRMPTVPLPLQALPASITASTTAKPACQQCLCLYKLYLLQLPLLRQRNPHATIASAFFTPASACHSNASAFYQLLLPLLRQRNPHATIASAFLTPASACHSNASAFYQLLLPLQQQRLQLFDESKKVFSLCLSLKEPLCQLQKVQNSFIQPINLTAGVSNPSGH